MIEKYGFIYIWFDSKRKMYYIGCHWGSEQDGYICSSDRMRETYRRRPQDFKRRILKSNITDKSKLLEEEYQWLSKIKDEDIGKRYYNLSTRHFGHWMMNDQYEKKQHPMFGKKHTEETKQKMRGRKVSEETRRKLRELAEKQFSDPENRKKAGLANIGVVRNGKKHTEDVKRKMSERMMGNTPWNKGKKDLPKHSEETKSKMRGRKVSEETRQKLSLKGKGRIPANKGKKTGPRSEETKRKISETKRKHTRFY